MKAHIYYWACQNFKELTGYEHDQEIPVEDVYAVMASIFEKGLNVMLYHSSDDNITLFVDNKRFGQR